MSFLRCRPAVEVGDLAAALDFLTAVVGLPLAVSEGEPPMFAIVGDGDATLALVESDEPALPAGAACYFTVTDLDGLIGRLDAAGIALDVPPTERPWGMRDIVVIVPGEGPRIAFGEPIES